MFTQKLKSVATTATAIGLAMSFGFAAPAFAASITSDVESLERGGATQISSDVANGNTIALFINGQIQTSQGWNGNFTASWADYSPCVDVEVTYRVYDEVYVDQVPDFADPYEGSVTLLYVGDNSPGVFCDDSWGTGDSGEPLAKTGADASALTGVAGVAALAAAVAVARRARRLQR